MCGRYYVDDDTIRETERIVREVDRKMKKLKAGDVYPSGRAAVITGKTNGLRLEEMNWGFPRNQGSGLLINARAETVLERKMFRENVRRRRCIIPAKWFYEWDAEKNKVSFMRVEEPVLYMAGFYGCFQDEERFIILTTQANDSVRPVHHRMPVILEKNELESWMCLGTSQEEQRQDDVLKSILNKIPPMLKREQEYEQQSLVFG